MRNSLFSLYGLIALVSFALIWSCSQGEEAVYQTVPNIDESVATMSSSGMTNLVIPSAWASNSTDASEYDTINYQVTYVVASVQKNADFTAIVGGDDLWIGASISNHYLTDKGRASDFLTDLGHGDIINQPMLLRNCRKWCGCENKRCAGEGTESIKCWRNCRKEADDNLREDIKTLLAIRVFILKF